MNDHFFYISSFYSKEKRTQISNLISSMLTFTLTLFQRHFFYFNNVLKIKFHFQKSVTILYKKKKEEESLQILYFDIKPVNEN